ISVSGIEDRATVKAKRSDMLHGNFPTDLTDDKYLVAKQFNIKVLLPECVLTASCAWSRSRIGQKYNFYRSELRKSTASGLQCGACDSDPQAACCLDIADYLGCRTMAQEHAGAKPANSSTPDKQRVPPQREDRARCQLACCDPDRSRVNETVASAARPTAASATRCVLNCRLQQRFRADSAAACFGGIQRHSTKRENNFRIQIRPRSLSALAPLRDLRLLIACCRGQQAELQRLTSMARQLGGCRSGRWPDHRAAISWRIFTGWGSVRRAALPSSGCFDCSRSSSACRLTPYQTALAAAVAAADEAHETGDSTMRPGDACACLLPPLHTASDMLERKASTSCATMSSSAAEQQDDEEGDETELPPVRSVVEQQFHKLPNVLPETKEPANSSTAADTQSLPDWPSRRHPRSARPRAPPRSPRPQCYPPWRPGRLRERAAEAYSAGLGRCCPVVYQRGSGGATEAGLLSADDCCGDRRLACRLQLTAPARDGGGPRLGALAAGRVVLMRQRLRSLRDRLRSALTTLGRGPRRHRQDNRSAASASPTASSGRVTTHLVLAASGQRHKILGRNGLGSVHCVTKHWLGECGLPHRLAGDYDESESGANLPPPPLRAMSATMSSAADTPTATAVAIVTSTMAASRCPAAAAAAARNPHRAAMDSPSVFFSTAAIGPRFDLQALSAALRSRCGAAGRHAGLAVQYAAPGRKHPPDCRAQEPNASCSSCCRRRPHGCHRRLSQLRPTAVARRPPTANGDFATPQTPQQAARLAIGASPSTCPPASAAQRRPQRSLGADLAQLAESRLAVWTRNLPSPPGCEAEGRRLMIPSCSAAMQPQPAATARRRSCRPTIGQPGLAAAVASGCDAGLTTARLSAYVRLICRLPPSLTGSHHHITAPSPSCASGSAAERRASRASLQELEQQLDCFGKGADNSPDGYPADVAGANCQRHRRAHPLAPAAQWYRAGQPAGPESSPPAASNPSRTSPPSASVGGSAQRLRRRAAGKAATVAFLRCRQRRCAATAAVRPNEPLLVGWRYTDSDGAAAAPPQPPPPQQFHAAEPAAPLPDHRLQRSGLKHKCRSGRTRDRLVSQIRGLAARWSQWSPKDPSHLRLRRLLRNEKLLRCALPPAAGSSGLPMLKRSAKAGRWLRGAVRVGAAAAAALNLRTPRPAFWPPAPAAGGARRGGRALSRLARRPAVPAETSWPASRRLLEAGGGRVVADGPPYPGPRASVSHAFCQRGQLRRLLGHPSRPLTGCRSARKRQQVGGGGQQRRSGGRRLQRRRLRPPPAAEAAAAARRGHQIFKADSAPLRFSVRHSGMLHPPLASWRGRLAAAAAGGGSGFTRAARIVLAPARLPVGRFACWAPCPVSAATRTFSNRALPAQLGAGGLNRARHSWQSLPACRRHAQPERLRPPSGKRRVQPQQQAAATPQQMPEVLLRVPVSQLLSVAYVRDSDRHTCSRCTTQPDANGTSQLCAMSDHARIHAQICAVGPPAGCSSPNTAATFGNSSTAPSVRCFNIRRRPSTSGASVLGAAATAAAWGWPAETARPAWLCGAATATDSKTPPR
uniref:BRCT domain-containing protein n=1 Tax=Macrostomum lignano TaxID=282301 RepID=A0A1I8F8N7_9PLAT